MRTEGAIARLGHVCVLASSLAFAGCTDGEPELESSESAIDVSAFVLPSLPATERARIVRQYDTLDPTDQVPRGLLEDAILYFDFNRPLIPKQDYLVVLDFAQFSGHDRFWLVDLASGSVEAHKVAHGDGSDPDNDGMATQFSNVEGSHQTSLGFYLSGEIYDGTHPHSMRLDGLSPDGSPNRMANTNVRDRLIVTHEASYVDDTSSSQQGRSNGCFALDSSIERSVVDRIHDGTLMYAAVSPLAPPVGRTTCGDQICDGGEQASCPADCGSGTIIDPVPNPEPDPDESGGCSTSGGAGSLLVVALVGLWRRKKRR